MVSSGPLQFSGFKQVSFTGDSGNKGKTPPGSEQSGSPLEKKRKIPPGAGSRSLSPSETQPYRPQTALEILKGLIPAQPSAHSLGEERPSPSVPKKPRHRQSNAGSIEDLQADKQHYKAGSKVPIEQNSELRRQLAASQGREGELRRQIEALTAANETLSQNQLNDSKRISNLAAELAEAKVDLAKRRQENTELKALRKGQPNPNADNATLAKVYGTAANRLHASEQQTKLQKDYANIFLEMAAIAEEKDTANAENKCLTDALRTVKQEIASLKQQLPEQKKRPAENAEDIANALTEITQSDRIQGIIDALNSSKEDRMNILEELQKKSSGHSNAKHLLVSALISSDADRKEIAKHLKKTLDGVNPSLGNRQILITHQ